MRNVTNNLAAKPDTEQVTRGRGRPRKPDAMTGAQRQAAYRERLRAASINVTVTEITQPTADAHNALVRECERMRANWRRRDAGLRDYHGPSSRFAILRTWRRYSDGFSASRRRRFRRAAVAPDDEGHPVFRTGAAGCALQPFQACGNRAPSRLGRRHAYEVTLRRRSRI